MIKVKYNATTTKVEGYFPSNINYSNDVIDKESKMINGNPYIEISKEEHEAALGKKMCVIGGSLTEYVKTNAEVLEETRSLKLGLRKVYLKNTDWYLVRELDEPGTYPKEIKDKRILARKERAEIKVTNTLEEINSYNEIFE
tara:strand:- start:4871 stop:5296 length:426 start_codon:yes stop_codon:yes gene_type:complete